MRTVNTEPCSRCKTPTNLYDNLLGRLCPSCIWDAVYNFKIGLASNDLLRLGAPMGTTIPDDGSCVLGKNKEEWLAKDPAVKVFPPNTPINFGIYKEE